MSTHNICFRGEIRKISAFFQMKKAPYLLLWVNKIGPDLRLHSVASDLFLNCLLRPCCPNIDRSVV